MAEQDAGTTPPPEPTGIGADWWSVIVSGVVVALAIAGLLPRIPW